MQGWNAEIVTRRMAERQIDELFDRSCMGSRVLLQARRVGLVSTRKRGVHYEQPLLPDERAALILISVLVVSTDLTLPRAADLVAQRQDWIRHAQSVAETGEDLVLTHTVGRVMVVVEVTIPNAMLRDPVLGINGDRAVALEAA